MILDVQQCIENNNYLDDVFSWYLQQKQDSFAPIIYSTTGSENISEVQAKYGSEETSSVVESFFHQFAKKLKDEAVQNFIVAGGETSGSIVQALNIRGFYIGPKISPGVPWVKSLDNNISLALKSGNFGDVDFFEKAQRFYNG